MQHDLAKLIYGHRLTEPAVRLKKEKIMYYTVKIVQQRAVNIYFLKVINIYTN